MLEVYIQKEWPEFQDLTVACYFEIGVFRLFTN